MTRIALVYGAIAGAVIIGAIIANFVLAGGEPTGAGAWFGYLIMIVALSIIFMGVKRYRDRELGGVIKFVPALLLGLAIALVASVIYVAAWEVYLAATGYQFIDQYTAGVIEAKRAAGLSGAALDREIANMSALAANYDKPLFRVPMTFLEIFPVGLVIALISAALLRNPKFSPARG